MMKTAFERYEAYKDSGLEWIGEIPAHWEMKRLKDVSFMQYSNVDKKTHEDEIAVKLCNYVDVYKNDLIDASLPFMQATANPSEIKRFTVKKHDVLVTKDSETADDIANPALVVESLPGVLCGYHLAQFRTDENTLYGPFLFRLLQSKNYGFRFVIYAKGITRVGLSTSSFSDALTPLPPPSEQKAIADYLGTKTTQIDRKIDLLTQKAEKYGQLKQSLINEIVTRGLDKTVPMKDSGVEWIGDIPAHWEMKRLKDVSFMQYSNVDKKTHEDETAVKLCNYVDVYKNDLIDASLPFMQATANPSEIKRFTVKRHDVLVTKDSETADDIANPALVVESLPGVLCGYHLAQIRTDESTLYGPFLFRLLQSKNYGFRFVIYAKGITRVGLSTSAFSDALTPLPPLPEQKAIANYLDTKTTQIDRIVETIHTEIEKLKELRKTLINDVVTGKIKVV